jgi:hypothetical protein
MRMSLANCMLHVKLSRLKELGRFFIQIILQRIFFFFFMTLPLAAKELAPAPQNPHPHSLSHFRKEFGQKILRI